jgi:hypothetical protein
MMASWAEHQKRIFGGESGGDYDALFRYSNRPGGRFAGTKLTDMTVNEAIAFANPRGEYARYVAANNKGTVASPMGAYQIVGSTLAKAKDWAGLTGEERMTPDIQDRLGKAVLANQGTGAWKGYGKGGGGKSAISKSSDDGSVQVASLDSDPLMAEIALRGQELNRHGEPKSKLAKTSELLADDAALMGHSGRPMPTAPRLQIPMPTTQIDTPLFHKPEPASMQVSSILPFADAMDRWGQEHLPTLFGKPQQGPPIEARPPLPKPVIVDDQGEYPDVPAQDWSTVKDPRQNFFVPDKNEHNFSWNAILNAWNQASMGAAPPMELGQKAGQWVADKFLNYFWLPENEGAKREAAAGGGTVQDQTKAPILTDEQLFGGVKEKPGSGGSATSTFSSIDAGTTFIPKEPPKFDPQPYPTPPEPGDVPDKPMVADLDWGPYLKKMEEYRPEDLDRQSYMKERLLGNLSRALAAGAGGSGWSGWGGAVARAGGGFGTAQADTTDQWLTDEQQREEAQRQWGLGQIDLEMKLAQRSQDIKNQNAGIGYENQLADYTQQEQYKKDVYNVDAKNIEAINAANQQNAKDYYDWQNTVGQLTQTTVQNVTDKEIVLKKVNPEGKTTFEVHRFDSPYQDMLSKDYLETLKRVEEQFPNSPTAYQLKYAPFIQQKNTWGIQAVMAEEMIRNGAAAQLLPNFEDLQKQATDIMTKQGFDASMTGYADKFSQTLATLLAPNLNIHDPNFLQQAAGMNTVGAALLLGGIAPPAGAPAAPSPNAGHQ